MDWTLVALMVGIHALMFLTPGPDSIIVVSRATSQSMKHAVVAALGVVSGGVILVPAIAFGLDFVNALSPAIWMAVRAAGAAYLIYIGWKMLMTMFSRLQGSDEQAQGHTHKTEPLLSAYLQALLTTLGNPKILVLLTSFLPQFVAPELGNISYQLLVLGFFLYLNGFVCLVLLAFLAVLMKTAIVGRFGTKRLELVGSGVAGTTMLGIGVWMLIAPVRFLLTSRTT